MHTELTMWEKTTTEKINGKLRVHTELINEKLKITDYKVEGLEAIIKFMSEKFEEQKSKLIHIRKLTTIYRKKMHY